MASSNKCLIIKNQFFMAIKHTKKFFESVHTEALFSQLIVRIIFYLIDREF